MKNGVSTKVVVINIIFIISIAILVIFLLTSKEFLVKEIEVKGNDKIKTEEIVNQSLIKKEKNIFLERYLKGKYNLSKNSKLEEVRFELKLPNKVIIHVKERSEDYQIITPSGYYVIDKNGYILRRTDEKQQLIVIKGLKEEKYDTKERLELKELYILEKLNKIYTNLNSLQMDKRITEIEVTNKFYLLKAEKEKKVIKLDIGTLDIRSILLKIREVMNINKDKEGEIIIDKNDKREYIIFKEKV